jgi:tetratricopeptide (TPR) repeat protein
MKKQTLLLLLILVMLNTGWSMSWRKPHEPREIYKNWQTSLKFAGRDSVTVRYRIQSEARKMLKKNKDAETLYYASLGMQLAEATESEITPLKEKIVTEFPASRACYNLANSEFYEKIYPVWNDDYEKIIIIEDLLLKYHSTSWRRTMYQYLCYSLANIGDKEMLLEYLQDWRNSFPQDYLPWFVSAANYQLMEEDINSTIDFAREAYLQSFAPIKPEFYPEEEWLLEKRAAKVKTAYILGKVLTDSGDYAEAEEVLIEALENNQLGIEDETTTGRIYYCLAKLYSLQQKIELAVENCCHSLVQGDSRNMYTPQADSLLKSLTKKESTLQTSRDVLNYSDVTFTDVTAELGLADVSGSRIAWGDYDRDGWEDFLLSGSRLFRNLKGKKFVDVTKDVFEGEISFGGAIWVDIDNDGDLDIITKDPENIWINRDNRFYKFNSATEFIDNGISSEGLAAGDINKDGNIDIYLANYEGSDNTYYHDNLYFGKGDGSFEEVTYQNGAIPHDSKPLAGRGVNMGDFNNDGLLDIYVSNYRLTRNLLYVNLGKGILKEKAGHHNLAGEEIDGWWGHTIGSEWGDFNNDGNLDLIACNLAHPRYIDFSNKTKLYLNSGPPDYTFTDIRAQAGIRFEETNSEPAWGDLDNDGYLDLYITNVYEGRRSFLYMNNGDNTFREVTWLSGTRHFNGWGVAYSDFDKDGDLDMLVAGGTIQLFRNDTKNENNWLEIEVMPSLGCDGIGTRLTLQARDLLLTREIQGGKGSTNQHSLVQHFGLGKRKSGIILTVEFPSGITRTVTVSEVNHRYIVKEGL